MSTSRSRSRLAACILLPAAIVGAQQFEVLQQTPLSTPVGAVATNGIVADIDGNGAPDVLLRMAGSVLMGDVGLRFVLSPPGDRIPLQLFPTNFHDISDVDGDGDLDLLRLGIVFIPSLQTRVEVLSGTPSGYFGTPVVSGSFPGLGSLLRKADVDGDGRDDLFVGSGFALGLMRNVAGAFVDVTATSLPAGLGGTALAVADVDGDSDRDFVVFSSGAVQLLVNDGSGVFTVAVGSGLPVLAAVEAMTFADADGDGDQDLLVATQRGAPLQLYLGNGAGAFVPSAVVMPFHGRSSSFVDLDADGDADILSVTASAPLPTLLVWRNAGTAFVPQTETMVDEGTELGDPAIADLDGDGDFDVVLGGSLFFVDEGTQRYAPLQRNGAWWTPDTSTMVAGDLDGDGAIDLVSGDSVHGGLGDGYFAPALPTVPAGGVARALFDADADGDLDLVWTTADPFTTQVGGLMVNQGGVLTALPPLTAGLLVGEVVAADFDGDGTTDLFSQSGVLLQNVAGAFVPAGTVIPGQGPSAVGDFNGDGRIDLAVGSATGWTQWRNQGGFLFQPFGSTMPLVPTCVAARDLDLDGDIDLVGGYLSSSFGGTFGCLQIFQNNGAGVFTGGLTLIDGSDAPRAVTIADVDEDGSPDLVGSRIWINGGSGTFVPRAGGVPFASASCVADFDNDGDLDAAYGLGHRVTIFANRHRHIGAPRVALLGHPFDIRMAARPGYGTPGAFVVNAVALNLLPPVVVPGLGRLHVDPAFAVFSPLATTGAAGTHTFTIQLPLTSVLAGVTAYWQGLVIDNGEARLTNFTAQRLVP